MYRHFQIIPYIAGSHGRFKVFQYVSYVTLLRVDVYTVQRMPGKMDLQSIEAIFYGLEQVMRILI